MLRIVVVDTGVDYENRYLKNYNNLGFSIKFYNENLIIDNNFKDDYGHGTAINYIIKNHIQQVEIINIKLFDNDEIIDENLLLKTLQYIYDNIECNILNLSLGISVSENYKKFYDICENLKNKNVIIISAFNNDGSMSYPASFDNVIGVSTDIRCKNRNEFYYCEDENINILGYGNIQKLAWVNPSTIILGGNSFACAHITGIIAKEFINKEIKFEKVKIYLKENSTRIIKSKNINLHNKENKIFEIEKAILFPFNKEMHSLIRYSDMLDFKITGVYDTKYSFNVGATTTHIMKDENVEEIKIKNYLEIDWDSFDTLILGHTDELSELIKVDLKEYLLTECLKRNKNLYSFDKLNNYDLIINKNLKESKIYFPEIKQNDLNKSIQGKLYKYSKPIVGIFGTSSKQGKFTLQLGIRKKLLELGYYIGQIGTEPSALLYGMDYVYPMGYNKTTNLKEEEVIFYLNNNINELCKNDKDIIIVGGQSGVLPYDTGNITFYSIHQIEFILSTQPDVVILCINPFDDVNYIIRTINFMENLIECKVISICIFPMNLKQDWKGIYGKKYKITQDEFNTIKQNLEKSISIPIFNLDEYNTIENITNIILDNFIGE